MDEHAIVRSMLLRIGEDAPASFPLAKALHGWAKQYGAWLIGRSAVKLGWGALLTALGEERPPAEARPRVLDLAAALGELLVLEPLDAALLQVVIAIDRLPRPAAVARIAAQHGQDLPALVGNLVGLGAHEAEGRVRRSPVLQLGLARFVASRQGHVELDLDWMLTRLLDRAPTDAADIVDALAGRRFVFKLHLAPLGRRRAEEAFERFFATPAPASLAEVSGLTPGDFAVVARQLRWTGAASPAELVERLRIEAVCKPGGGGRIGF